MPALLCYNRITRPINLSDMARRAQKIAAEIEMSEPLREGFIVDYISGRQVKDGPEEREAVQVFSRSLVEDYNYPKESHSLAMQ